MSFLFDHFRSAEPAKQVRSQNQVHSDWVRKTQRLSLPHARGGCEVTAAAAVAAAVLVSRTPLVSCDSKAVDESGGRQRRSRRLVRVIQEARLALWAAQKHWQG